MISSLSANLLHNSSEGALQVGGGDTSLIFGGLSSHLFLLGFFSEDLSLFFLERVEFRFDFRIIIISHVLSEVEFWPFIVAPVLILKKVVLLLRDVELASTSVLLLEFLDGRSSLLGALDDSLGDCDVSHFVVSLLRLRHVELAHDALGLLGILRFLSEAMIQEDVAGLGFHVVDSVSTDVTHLDQIGVGLLGHGLDLLLDVLFQFGELANIDFGENNNERLGLEEGLNVIEQGNLLLDGVATVLRDIKEEEHTGVEMSQGGNSLHLNSVSLVQLVVEQARSVDNLPVGVFVVGVTHEQTLGGERVGLHVDVGL
mmetsp:Transcript_35797/g.54860  ORF Transcript_35797/g.54860 Transcript_35797/m.54860 type:complete len:314 (-) Transcript_35797:574-1515(-)